MPPLPGMWFLIKCLLIYFSFTVERGTFFKFLLQSFDHFLHVLLLLDGIFRLVWVGWKLCEGKVIGNVIMGFQMTGLVKVATGIQHPQNRWVIWLLLFTLKKKRKVVSLLSYFVLSYFLSSSACRETWLPSCLYFCNSHYSHFHTLSILSLPDS